MKPDMLIRLTIVFSLGVFRVLIATEIAVVIAIRRLVVQLHNPAVSVKNTTVLGTLVHKGQLFLTLEPRS